jgi:hypothetical protein
MLSILKKFSTSSDTKQRDGNTFALPTRYDFRITNFSRTTSQETLMKDMILTANKRDHKCFGHFLFIRSIAVMDGDHASHSYITTDVLVVSYTSI